jgi:hypothetical protein
MNIKYFTELKSGFDAFELKMEYKNLAVKNHPDKGGSVKTFQAIFAEFEYLSKNIGSEIGSAESATIENFEDFCASVDLELFEVYQKVKQFFGNFTFDVEICGIYMYITNIEEYKTNGQLFKALGFFWNKGKKSWTFKPNWYKCYNRKSWSMNKIRDVHDSAKAGKSRQGQIAA